MSTQFGEMLTSFSLVVSRCMGALIRRLGHVTQKVSRQIDFPAIATTCSYNISQTNSQKMQLQKYDLVSFRIVPKYLLNKKNISPTG